MKTAHILIVFLSITLSSFGQNIEPALFSPDEIRWTALVTFAAPQGLYQAGRSLLNPTGDPATDVLLSSQFLAGGIPLLLLPGGQTPWYIGMQLGALGLRAVSPLAGPLSADLERLGFYGLLDFSYLDTYETYKRMRLNAKLGAYPTGWKSHSLPDLLLAPFNPTALSIPIVWGSILGEACFNTLAAAFSSPQENAVWTTGRAYLGSTEVPIWAGFMERSASALSSNMLIAAGEESVFRGVIFEELRVAFGELPARLIDMVLFPTLHIFNWVSKGLTFEQILPQFLFLVLDAFLLDSAYLEGGLPASIAMHCWINTSNRLLDWGFGSGAPQAALRE
jgi:membrane protease YdiL (CAAX protease family)